MQFWSLPHPYVSAAAAVRATMARTEAAKAKDNATEVEHRVAFAMIVRPTIVCPMILRPTHIGKASMYFSPEALQLSNIFAT
jgi:hypothetical protein